MAFVAAGLRTSGQTDARPAQLGGTGRRNARPRAVVVGSLVLWPLRPVPLSAVVLLVLERVVGPSAHTGSGGNAAHFFSTPWACKNLVYRILSRMQTNYAGFRVVTDDRPGPAFS